MAEGESKYSAGRGIPAAPIAAMLGSLATLTCCLPAGFLAAAGAAGAGVFIERYRTGLLVLSIVFVGLGFWQLRRARQCGFKPSPWTKALLWIAAAMVLLVGLFPQEIAGFFADHLAWAAQ